MIAVLVGSIYALGMVAFVLWMVTDDDRLMILTFCLVALSVGLAIGYVAV